MDAYFVEGISEKLVLYSVNHLQLPVDSTVASEQLPAMPDPSSSGTYDSSASTVSSSSELKIGSP